MQPAAKVVALGQGAAIEDRIAFSARRQQASLGQYLEVMADAGLSGGKNLRQLEHAERVAGQRAQYVQPQRIAAGLAQGGELIAVVERYLGNAQAHRQRSLVGRFSSSNANIKKF